MNIQIALLNIVHLGRAPFLMKKSAKLTRSRAAPKADTANYHLFNRQESRTSIRSGVQRRARESTFSTSTIEMTDEYEEEAGIELEHQRFGQRR